jgi:hypothetical protein
VPSGRVTALPAQPQLRDRLRAAVERRYDALRDTAGLNADVFDALVLLAATGCPRTRPAPGKMAIARFLTHP